MTPGTEAASRQGARVFNRLRANALAAITMLVIEFGLGTGVNLYVALPTSDRGKSLLSAFGSALVGPVPLAIHALLGTLLLITGASAVIRASGLREPALIAITGSSLLGILTAWLAGAWFVGSMADGASMAMAGATAVSILGYSFVLFLTPRSPWAPS